MNRLCINPTKRQSKVMLYLIAKGYELSDSGHTSKYLKMVNKAKQGYPLWIGKAGAVRYGRTISDSFSVTHKIPKL